MLQASGDRARRALPRFPQGAAHARLGRQRIPRLKEWEGGSRTRQDVPESKRGHGFLAVTGRTAEALPAAVRFGKLHEHEKAFVLDMLCSDIPRLREHLDPERIGVSTLDGIFAEPDIRQAHRLVGYLENTHRVAADASHETTNRNLDKHRHMVFEIEGHPNWRANGLRQLFCMCDEGDTYARPKISKRAWRPRRSRGNARPAARST